MDGFCVYGCVCFVCDCVQMWIGARAQVVDFRGKNLLVCSIVCVLCPFVHTPPLPTVKVRVSKKNFKRLRTYPPPNSFEGGGVYIRTHITHKRLFDIRKALKSLPFIHEFCVRLLHIWTQITHKWCQSYTDKSVFVCAFVCVCGLFVCDL